LPGGSGIVGGVDLMDLVAGDFGIRLASIEPVDGGVDRAAQNFRGRTGSADYAIKWSSGGTAAGMLVPAALRRLGERAVAAPVPARDGRLWSDRDGRRLSVVPWVGDHRGLDHGLDATQWREFGALMAATHALPVTEELAAVLPVAGHDRELAEVRAADERLRTGAPSDVIAARAQQLWLEHSDRIAAVVTDVEAYEPAAAGSVVCHTDPHLGNVLAAPERMWLIDWDDAALSFPEQDLMFVLGGAYGDEHIGDDQRASFFEGYGTTSMDAGRLAYWRGVRGLSDVAFLADEAFAPGEQDDAWREHALHMLAGNLGPDGLITLALERP
jgi:spectinomycin phosphotransferase